MKNKFLKFEKRELGSSITYHVENKDNQFLGRIWLNKQWKEWVFEPEFETYYSAGCLKQIVEFMERL